MYQYDKSRRNIREEGEGQTINQNVEILSTLAMSVPTKVLFFVKNILIYQVLILNDI